MACSNCGKDQEMAKGLCNACYIRQYRFGTLEVLVKQPTTPKEPKNNRPCQNCGVVPVKAHELCAKCYGRMLRHGHVNQTRPVNYGKVGKSAMRWHWQGILKTLVAKRTTICEQWRNDLEQFVKDVGERPSKQHMLRRIDLNKGYEPGNVYWHEKTISKHNTETHKEYAARYQREYRKLSPDNVKSSTLKKYFGIDLTEFNRMSELQSNVCGICGNPETNHDKSGRLMSLHVDHCHTTNKIRALLCSKCNTGIGLFKDDVDLLQKAIDYLNFHKIKLATD